MGFSATPEIASTPEKSGSIREGFEMKPLHAAITRLSRCPCCQSKYSKKNAGRNKNHGKTAARMKAKREINKEMHS